MLRAWLPTWRFTRNLAIGTAWAMYMNSHVVQPMWVSGASMRPFLNADFDETVSARDVVLIWMWNPHENVKRGSVVAFWSPFDPERMAIKRVIALEGDEITTKKPYAKSTEVVPKGHVWLEGENIDGRKNMDSNWYGPISKSLIVGKAAAVVWPWRKAGVISPEYYRGSPRVVEGKHVDTVEKWHTDIGG